MKRLFGSGSGRRFEAEWLVVGLGNPGEKYARHRHNVGFWVVNDLAKRAGAQLKTTGSTMQIGVGTLAGAKVALVKPTTYMNESGRALGQAKEWTGCDAPHTVVVYDELDMTAGALRLRQGGGHGGHNGLKSIMSRIGPDFVRIRIGIGRPAPGGEPTWDPEEVAAWVLSAPMGNNRTVLEDATRLAADAVEAIITDGVDVAGNRYNRKSPVPVPAPAAD